MSRSWKFCFKAENPTQTILDLKKLTTLIKNGALSTIFIFNIFLEN
jgi:hypothetical protein